MAGVDYNEWGVDFEEWERMETDNIIPPHLYADDHYYQEHEDKRDEEVIKTMETSAIDELCGSIEFKNQLTSYVFDERSKKGGDDYMMQSPKAYVNVMNRSQGIKRLKMLVVVMMVVRFLRRQIL
ncbi:hypothetical protein QVD17_37256 [Tagetes erecta]|uniref:Uncharacterized protein n=1 Tax=Tagetes erecta TaxID=13708 RepID=A0AAD8NJ09_TARER|nr:hypothetical protein QVD17_37256 [Tagetes erecta]